MPVLALCVAGCTVEAQAPAATTDPLPAAHDGDGPSGEARHGGGPEDICVVGTWVMIQGKIINLPVPCADVPVDTGDPGPDDYVPFERVDDPLARTRAVTNRGVSSSVRHISVSGRTERFR